MKTQNPNVFFLTDSQTSNRQMDRQAQSNVPPQLFNVCVWGWGESKYPLCISRLTLQTRVAVVVFPIPGGPDKSAALNPAPSSLPDLPKNRPAVKTEKMRASQGSNLALTYLLNASSFFQKASRNCHHFLF